MSLKHKTSKYWIKMYCYNNALILPIKRRIKNEVCSNLLLLLLSPYIIANYLFTICYERVWGFRKVRKRMEKDRNVSFKHELALVSISKNEGPYIREWIEFHRMVGVSKFYFYDNDSNDDTESILRPYVEEGLVDYVKMPGIGMQLIAYNDALQKHKDECRWMGFIDMDEYLVPSEPFKLIADVVDDIVYNASPGAAGLAINWAVFGSSNHKTKPQGTISENYTLRAVNDYWANKHVKCICNPRLVTNYISPHYPLYIRGGILCASQMENVLGDGLRLTSSSRISA